MEKVNIMQTLGNMSFIMVPGSDYNYGADFEIKSPLLVQAEAELCGEQAAKEAATGHLMGYVHVLRQEADEANLRHKQEKSTLVRALRQAQKRASRAEAKNRNLIENIRKLSNRSNLRIMEMQGFLRNIYNRLQASRTNKKDVAKIIAMKFPNLID
jgi:hypothetical protein